MSLPRSLLASAASISQSPVLRFFVLFSFSPLLFVYLSSLARLLLLRRSSVFAAAFLAVLT
jgi:hypothetical protein